jgi:hypothetical protein
MRTVMTLAPHPRSTAANLLRLLAAWLVAIILVQGIAAAQALGLGALHRHVAASAHTPHHHDGAERHHHERFEPSTLRAEPDAALDAAATRLAAALALLVIPAARASADAGQHVFRAAAAWACATWVADTELRPPRRA